MKFSDNIPEALIQSEEAKRFVRVLDELCSYKDITLYDINKSFNFLLQPDIVFLKKYLYELGQLKVCQDLPRACYEKAILGAYDIFSYKGTPKGLSLFAQALALGDATIDFSNNNPETLIAPDDYRYMRNDYGASPELLFEGDGFLPDGEDLGNTGSNKFLFLFEDGMLQFMQDITINVTSKFSTIATFQNCFANMLPEFLANITLENTELTVNFYDENSTLINTIIL